MSAGEQLAMFEPTGSDLVEMAARHGASAEKFVRLADNCAMLGRMAAAGAYSLLSELSEDSANTCELALQFEQLAGLA